MSTIFLRVCFFYALLPTFRFSFFFSFFSYSSPSSRYVYLLRVSSSVQQQSATVSKYVFYSTCSFCCVICTLPHLGTLFLICLAFFFRISYFSGDIFVVVVLSYPVRQHLICLPRIFSVWFSSVQRSVTTEFSSLYDGESGRTLGVLLTSLGRKNGLIRRQQQRHAQWITPRIVDGPHHPAGK